MEKISSENNRIKIYNSNVLKAALISAIGIFFAVSCSDSGTGVDEKSHASAIQFDIDDAYIAIDDIIQPGVMVLDGNGKAMGGLTITWSSSQSNVAEVNSSGQITGKAPGSTVIEASVEGIKNSIQVDVFLGTGQGALELQEIDRAVMGYLQSQGIPGGSLAVVKDGRLVLSRGYGYADPQTQKMADPTTLFRYGSVSKPITSIAVMMLLQQGLLQMDDKPFSILSHLPVLPGETEDPRLNDVTLEQLLTHSAGWNPNRNVDNRIWQAVSQLGERDSGKIFRYGRGVALSTDPGTQYAYSNYATKAAARLMEFVTSTGYEEWVKTNVFLPLGVTHVKFGKTALTDRDPDEARYHRANGYRPDTDDGAMIYYDASGSWIGRAVDLVRLLNGVEGKGGLQPLLTNQSIEIMTQRPGFYPTSGNYYAKYWSVNPVSGGLNWHHAGLADGAFADVWRMANGVTYAILLNQSPPGPRPDLTSVLNTVSNWPEHDLFDLYY
ncbi:MAG: serine hydrolase [Rhodothermaceae bacterium]|nr:serine hydrolase [Rhodothermaceae bacterium]